MARKAANTTDELVTPEVIISEQAPAEEAPVLSERTLEEMEGGRQALKKFTEELAAARALAGEE